LALPGGMFDVSAAGYVLSVRTSEATQAVARRLAGWHGLPYRGTHAPVMPAAPTRSARTAVTWRRRPGCSGTARSRRRAPTSSGRTRGCGGPWTAGSCLGRRVAYPPRLAVGSRAPSSVRRASCEAALRSPTRKAPRALCGSVSEAARITLHAATKARPSRTARSLWPGPTSTIHLKRGECICE
jgi:hypothetical protein